jgi:hypothetical protein
MADDAEKAKAELAAATEKLEKDFSALGAEASEIQKIIQTNAKLKDKESKLRRKQ